MDVSEPSFNFKFIQNLMTDIPNFAHSASFQSLLKLSQTSKEMRERMLPILKAKRVQELLFLQTWLSTLNRNYTLDQLTQQHGSFPAGAKPAGAGSRHSSGVVAGRSPESEALAKQRCNLNRLDLSNNQITKIPPEIGQLTHLKELILADNQITVIPPEIGQLTHLTFLCLDYNKITVIPQEIGQLTHLEHLYLSYNQITVIPPEIGQLSNLKTLTLYRNQITEIPPEIGLLTNLICIYIGHNKITEIPQGEYLSHYKKR